ncbi:MAG: Gfo/Idh/MocA family oxidoreductase, partial [Clostridium sp.]|nr:Gfo/Idh/MocA family oxidoreductase [Clostridium sp.]
MSNLIKKPLNVGIIGCGDVTEVKSGPAFQKLPGSNLTYVMRRNEKKLKDYAKRHRVEKYSTNYEDLLEDESIDLVYIATPPNVHKFYTEQAAKAKKHVYVEKPMAMTVKECEEMVEICKKEGVKLFVAYYRRGQEKFESIRASIESEEIGEIRSFQMLYTSEIPEFDPNRPWVYDKEISGGGKLYDVGSHMIDMLLFLFGDVAYAKGISSNQSHTFDVSDVTSGIMTFKNGVQGTVQMNFNAMEDKDELLIIGSRGSMKFSVM